MDANSQRELRIRIHESDYRALKTKADLNGVSQSEIVRRALTKYLGEEAAVESAPWLADMIDAVLSRYFQGFPQVLDRLVLSAFEEADWTNTQVLKLLELSGIKDPAAQDQRFETITTQIRAHAREKADEFFQALNGPEELIESDEPAAE